MIELRAEAGFTSFRFLSHNLICAARTAVNGCVGSNNNNNRLTGWSLNRFIRSATGSASKTLSLWHSCYGQKSQPVHAVRCTRHANG